MMKRAGIWAAAALVIAANAVALLGVARNRAGEPDAAVRLTERELRLWRIESENSGLSLHLQWETAGGGRYEAPGWFGAEKLAALGFDCSRPLGDSGAELWYDKLLPVEGYAVLEQDGEAWAEWLKDQERGIAELEKKVRRGKALPKSLQEARRRLEVERVQHSRLFAIDVGLDARALRRRYPDASRHIVTPAVLRLIYVRPWAAEGRKPDPPTLRGDIGEILIDEIHVPRSRRAALDGLGVHRLTEYWKDDRRPLYEVELRYGRRHEPWIEEVRPLDAGAGGPLSPPGGGSGP